MYKSYSGMFEGSNLVGPILKRNNPFIDILWFYLTYLSLNKQQIYTFYKKKFVFGSDLIFGKLQLLILINYNDKTIVFDTYVKMNSYQKCF